jgi:hypothetical protein
LKAALEQLVDPLTRGDPTSPLRWTCKSRAQLTAALVTQGWAVSSTTVGRLLPGSVNEFWPLCDTEFWPPSVTVLGATVR